MRVDLPTGTVTFLFTDVEGSTRLLEELGVERYGEVLAEHHRVCRVAWAAHGGLEVDTAGDAFFVVFEEPAGAVAAAGLAQEGLAPLGLGVRMGVHTGEVSLNETGYVGLDVHRAARIAAAGHGGQVLVSAATALLLDVPLRDLGEHRFKDLRAPERVFQLGDAEFPPIRSLYRSNLPVPASSFVGRERELSELVGLLSQEGVRLVTLTGPGGTGKTRLALQAAAELSDSFPDGVWWVSLAPLRDPALVLSAVAQVLEVRAEPGRGMADTLVERLGGKQVLVLLDNAEQLLPGLAGELSPLVRDSGTARFLVTSRERLQVTGEQVYAVPELAAEEGVELFLARAASAGVTLASSDEVVELCARLDQLPLALELAAVRTVLFNPAQLLERLGQRLDLLKGGRDVDPRQQTLRATIEWSHDLLDESEQQLFRRLSVFAGGCTYAAAEQVAGATADIMQSLLDKSLLRRRDDSSAEPRYWMLETIREYAAERLAEREEELDLREEHAGWLERWVSHGAPEYVGVGEPGWNERIEREEDNARAALGHLQSADPGRFVRFAGLMWNHWYFSSRLHEGRDWLTAARRIEPRSLPILRGLSNFSVRLGDVEAARSFAEQEIEAARDADSLADVAEGLRDLGNAAYWGGDTAAAATTYEESARVSRLAGHEAGLIAALGNLGGLALSDGRWEDGLELAAEEQRMAEKTGDDYARVIGVFNQGLAHVGAGRPAAAKPFFVEALRVGLDWGFPEGIVYPLEGLAMVASARGEHERVALILGASSAARKDIGLVTEQPHGRLLDDAAATARAALGEQRHCELEQEGREQGLSDLGGRVVAEVDGDDASAKYK